MKQNNETSYWLFCVVLLAIAYLLLLVVIAVRCYINRVLTILSLLSYGYIMLGYDKTRVFKDIDITKTDDSYQCVLAARKNDYSINYFSMTKYTVVYRMNNADLSE